MRYAWMMFLVVLAGLSAPARGEVVFDTLSNATGVSAAPNSGNTFMGQMFNLGGTSRAINEFTIAVANTSGAALNLTAMQGRIQLYDTLTPTGANAFADPLGGLSVVNVTPFVFANNTAVSVTFSLATPIVIADGTGGIVINWLADTGSGLNSIAGLTTAIRGGGTNPGPAVGSFVGTGPNFGYFRNASGRTDFNFNGTTPGPSDFRNVGVNSGLAISISAVPEPSSITMLSAAGLGMLCCYLRRRS
ncbi:MAG: hypothetical protein JNL67_04355 [Planctomycetaceae bacterium]|nr:hypothetical protein [Planctomycetaceae bacterium]